MFNTSPASSDILNRLFRMDFGVSIYLFHQLPPKNGQGVLRLVLSGRRKFRLKQARAIYLHSL